MKVFLHFVRKEFLHIFRDRRTLILVLGVPVLLVLAFGFALTTDLRNVRVYIASERNSPLVSLLIQKIDASDNLRVAGFGMPSDRNDQYLLEGKAEAVINLPHRWEEEIAAGTQPVLQIRLDAMDYSSATRVFAILQGLIYQTIEEYFATQRELQKPDFDPSSSPRRIDTREVLLYNPEMRAAYYFVPGVMGLVLMIVCAMMTSVSIVREKEYGSMELLLTSPVHPRTILTAKAIPYFCISCINVASILSIAHYVLAVPVLGPWWLIALVSLLFILVALLLGLLISTLTSNQTIAMFLSGAGLLLPVSMLSGMFFPIESMPRWLAAISHVVPAKWYVEAITKLLIRGVGWQGIQLEVFILLGMAVLLSIVSIRSFRLKL